MVNWSMKRQSLAFQARRPLVGKVQTLSPGTPGAALQVYPLPDPEVITYRQLVGQEMIFPHSLPSDDSVLGNLIVTQS